MKVVCIGEMLIDFVCTDTNQGLVNGVNYVKKSGGAPANVAACIAKLGGHAELVASVGNDPYGQFLINEIDSYKVNTQFVSVLPMSTTFAFVSLADDGEREFAFNRGADEQLVLSEDDINSLTKDSIIHLGSATALLGGELGKSYLSLAKKAKQLGNIICFDPNFRIGLWAGKEAEFKRHCDTYFALADIVKVSDEELVLLTGQKDMFAACQYFHDFGVKLVLVTLGGDGCLVSHCIDDDIQQEIVPAYKIKVVDTTGAGDSFIGAILYQLSTNDTTDDFYRDSIKEYVSFAGKVSGLVCSKIGAMSALPSLQELNSIEFEIAVS